MKNSKEKTQDKNLPTPDVETPEPPQVIDPSKRESTKNTGSEGTRKDNSPLKDESLGEDLPMEDPQKNPRNLSPKDEL